MPLWVPPQRRPLLTRRQALAALGGAALAAAARSPIVTAGGLPVTGSDSPVLPRAVTWPRFAVQCISGHQNYGHDQSTLVSYLCHMDVAVIGANWEGSAARNGWNRNTLVNAVNAGDGVVNPIVMQYNTCDRIGAPGGSGLGTPSSTATPIWWGQFDAMVAPWSVWENGDSGTHVSSGYYPGNPYAWLTNPCDLGSRSKDANGNAMYAAYAKYVHDYFFAGSTADAAAPNLGGFYNDNFAMPYGNPVGDYLQDGNPAAPAGTNSGSGSSVMIADAILAGLAEAVTWWHNNAPGKLFCGNSGWENYYSDDNNHRVFERQGVIGALATTAQVDCQDFQGFMGETAAMEHYYGLAKCAQYMAYNASISLSPQFNLNENDGINPSGQFPGATSSVGAGVRYWLASGWALDNGCPCYMAMSNVSGGHYPTLDWFDWLSVNPATGVCLSYASSTQAQIGQYRKWMGTAIDPPQTRPTTLFSFSGGPNVFARRFLTSNGRTALVIVNESASYHKGNTPAVITLPSVQGGWQALTASSGNYGANATIDSGATGLTRVTIATGDARILLH
jgi:hypothetical protein